MRCNGSNWAVYSPGSWDGFRNDVWALWAGVIMRLEHHLVGGYVRYISPHIIIIIIINNLYACIKPTPPAIGPWLKPAHCNALSVPPSSRTRCDSPSDEFSRWIRYCWMWDLVMDGAHLDASWQIPPQRAEKSCMILYQLERYKSQNVSYSVPLDKWDLKSWYRQAFEKPGQVQALSRPRGLYNPLADLKRLSTNE